MMLSSGYCASNATRSCQNASISSVVHEYDRCHSGTSIRGLVVASNVPIVLRPAS
jgi:hypothetical protein